MLGYQKRLCLQNGVKRSVFCGVSWRNDINKWTTSIVGPSGVTMNLGSFSDEHVAALVYDTATRQLYKERGPTKYSEDPPDNALRINQMHVNDYVGTILGRYRKMHWKELPFPKLELSPKHQRLINIGDFLMVWRDGQWKKVQVIACMSAYDKILYDIMCISTGKRSRFDYLMESWAFASGHNVMDTTNNGLARNSAVKLVANQMYPTSLSLDPKTGQMKRPPTEMGVVKYQRIEPSFQNDSNITIMDSVHSPQMAMYPRITPIPNDIDINIRAANIENNPQHEHMLMGPNGLVSNVLNEYLNNTVMNNKIQF